MKHKILNWSYRIAQGIFAGVLMWVIFNIVIQIRLWLEIEK